MMKKALLVLAMTASCFAWGAEPKKDPKAWHAKMRGLEQSFQELLMDLSSDERYNEPKNFKRIEKNAQKFASLAHALKDQPGSSPDSDPTIRILAAQFSSEAQYAYKAMKWGHRGYARDILRSMTSYCMACHTRSGGPSFQTSSAPTFVASLNGLERGNYYASVRQFEKALDEYESALPNERAARSALAVAVRVKKDPDRSLAIVEKVLSSAKTPAYLKSQATQWKQSLETWKSEARQKTQTEEGYYAQALKLVSEAKATQKYPADRSADVLYLRASSAVHDLMSVAPDGVHSADALFLAGLCYEVLEDLHLWDVHELYYLACIHKAPHSEKARQCYEHYEQSIYLSHTGSSGTDIPAETREKLRQLDVLSAPRTQGMP